MSGRLKVRNAATGRWDYTSGDPDHLVHVAAGEGSIVIPGARGWPDAMPASPSAWDDEFNGALSGWSMLGSLDTSEANVIPSQYHLKKTSPGAWTLYGIYKKMPTPPFTVTTHISDCRLDQNYQRYGLMILQDPPRVSVEYGNMYWWSGTEYENNGYGIWLDGTSRIGWSGDLTHYPASRAYFIRMIVNSPLNITMQTSVDGYVWRTDHNVEPANRAYSNVGFCATGENGDVPLEACFDWIRFSDLGPQYVAAIPPMTSNTTPSGVASASSAYSSSPPYCAFNGDQSVNLGAGWITNGTSSGWLQYQFPSPITAVRYSIRPWWYDDYPGRTPKNWTFEVSNNGASWTVLDTQTNWSPTSGNQWAAFIIASPGSYSYYRLNVSANNGSAYMGVGNFQIYTAA